MARPEKVVSLVQKKNELTNLPKPDDSWIQIEDF
jgi:hypothetical protein